MLKVPTVLRRGCCDGADVAHAVEVKDVAAITRRQIHTCNSMGTISTEKPIELVVIVLKKPIRGPGFAVIDLRLSDGNGLEVVKTIRSLNYDSRVIMLTGYGNIPTAVAAVKQGAIDYLSKPADAEDVEKALLADPAKKAAPPENPMSADRVKWEHIHRVFELCNRNVSETARRLKMHRRTLQRILSKRSPR